MTDPAIIEAAARAMCRDTIIPEARWHVFIDPVEPILAAVTPLIEAAALEKAAKVAEDTGKREYEAFVQLKAEGNEEKASIYASYVMMANVIAAAIRALITKDSGGRD